MTKKIYIFITIAFLIGLISGYLISNRYLEIKIFPKVELYDE
jgi:uncharacterized protein YneF (UPF0154 family)